MHIIYILVYQHDTYRIPAVFRTVPPSPGRGKVRRSTSTSSQKSLASDKNNLNNIPPLQLDSSEGPYIYGGSTNNRSSK